MAYLDNARLQYLWENKIVPSFARKIKVSATASAGTVEIQNNAGTALASASIPAATSSAAGLMTAAEKTKLAGIAEGATATDENTTYTLSGSGRTVTLTPSEGDAQSYTIPNQDLSSYATTASVNTLLASYTKTANLATVAISGKYSDLSGRPTIDTAISTTSTNAVTNAAITKYVDDQVAATAAGAVNFKGVVNAASEIEGLSSYTAGWYWVVGTAGTYCGQTCEVGDQIFCTAAATTYSADNFNVLQANLVAMTNAEIDAVCTL